jgi:tetratricopeptide (TPR) repeat protein
MSSRTGTLRFSVSITENKAPVRWIAPLLVAVTLLAYGPALRDGFVWNDPDYVTRPELRSAQGLARIWFQVGATEQYYPALHSAFWVEHRLWGDAPLGYHLANVLLHAAAAVLLTVLLRRLAVPGAALAGLLFAVHPVMAESVAWVSEQKNTLSTVLYLLAAIAYFKWRYKEGGGAAPYWLGLAAFVAALLSKSVTATLPAALLVVAWWREGRLSWRRDWVPLLPWLGLAAAAGLFTAWVERTYIGAEGGAFALGFAPRILIAGRAVWFYLAKLVWPARLMFIYPRWQVDPGAAWPYLFPLAALAALAALWLLRSWSRAPLAAALLFVGSLFPVLGFLNVYAFVFSFVADHFQYLASLGVLALAGAVLALLLARVPAWLAWLACAGLLGSLARETRQLCGRYRDLPTFYRAILADNPHSWLAHANLGNLLREDGRNAEAIPHYVAALREQPDAPQIENNLGLALAATGRNAEAIAHFRAALRLRPSYAQVHSNLGTALRVAGRNEEAIAEYEAALRFKPDYAEDEYNLGLVLRAAGRTQEAIARFQAALRHRPEFPEALADLGNALRDAGHPDSAIAAYEQALRLRPASFEALNNLGNLLVAQRRTPEAIARFTAALRAWPDSAVLHNDLGVALAAEGRLAESLAQFAEAVRLDPATAAYRRNLAILRSQAGGTP